MLLACPFQAMLPYRNECQVGWPQGVAGGRQADEEFNEFIIVTYLLHIFYYFLLEGYFFGGILIGGPSFI